MNRIARFALAATTAFAVASPAIALAQGVEHLSVGRGRQREPAGGSHVSGEVSAGNLAESRDQLQQSPVVTAGEQHPVPLVLEIEAGSHVTPGLLGKGIGTDCLLCHAGRVAGQTVIGLGNSALDLQGLFDEL